MEQQVDDGLFVAGLYPCGGHGGKHSAVHGWNPAADDRQGYGGVSGEDRVLSRQIPGTLLRAAFATEIAAGDFIVSTVGGVPYRCR